MLWGQPVQVAWEERCFPHILDAGQARHAALQPDGEATT